MLLKDNMICIQVLVLLQVLDSNLSFTFFDYFSVADEIKGDDRHGDAYTLSITK